eukprot:gene7126-8501_t
MADLSAEEEAKSDLPQISLTYGDDTRLPVTVREAAFTCHILASQQLALVKVALVVCNDTVESDVEASLRFPLPGDAVVCDYTFQQEETTLQAISVPKKKAAAVAYLEKEKGRQVSKTTNVQGNVWQTDIYPLPYQKEREITLSLLCKLDVAPASTPLSLLLELPLSFAAPVRRVSVSVESPDCPSTAGYDNLGGAAAATSLPEGLLVTLPLAAPRRPAAALAATDGTTVHWSAFLSSADLEGLLASTEGPPPPATSSSPQPLGPIDVGIVWDASRSAAAAKDARLALLSALDKEYRQLGRDVAYTVFTFGTASDRVASRAPFASAQAAILEVRYDGGTDLSLLDGILSSVPLHEGGPEGAAVPLGRFECFVLLSDGLDNLPGKRLPTLQGNTVPVHAPLPAASDQANPTVLRWLGYQTGGVCLPLQGGGNPQRCAAAMAGVTPQTMITSVRTDLSSDLEALADEDMATVPDHRLFRVSVPAAPEGLWVSGACAAAGRRPGCVTVTLERGAQRAEVTLDVPPAAQELPSPLSARLLAVHHATMSLDEIKLQHYDPDVVVTHATNLATRYGLATEHTTLLLLRLPEQFAEHDLQCPEGHPAYDAWKVLAEERLLVRHEREQQEAQKVQAKIYAQRRYVERFHEIELRSNERWDARHTQKDQAPRKAAKGGARVSASRMARRHCRRSRNQSHSEEDEDERGSELEAQCDELMACASNFSRQSRSIPRSSSPPPPPAAQCAFSVAPTLASDELDSFMAFEADCDELVGCAYDVSVQSRRISHSSSPPPPPAPPGAFGAAPPPFGAAPPPFGAAPPPFGAAPPPASGGTPGPASPPAATDTGGGGPPGPAAAPPPPPAPPGAFDVAAAAKKEQFLVPSTAPPDPLVAINDAMRKGGHSAGYEEYLKWSEDQQLCGTPSFFVLAAEALRDAGAPAETCAKVVYNVLETKLPDAQTCRVVAYHLVTVARWTEAVWLLELVSDLAPEEPNSYTDLAFARVHRLRHECADVADVDSEVRQVVAHLVRVIKGSWAQRFDEIEWPCLLLLSWVVGWAEWKWPERYGAGELWPESDLSAGLYRLRSKLPCRKGLQLDLFVWLGWDTDHTDVDLHVTEPRGEEVYYGHNVSRETGASVSRDFTAGYGPEVYTCPRAPDGKYDIQTNYFANYQVSGSTGGTSAVIWSIENLGNFEEERVQFTTTRLVTAKQRQSVLTIDVLKDSQIAARAVETSGDGQTSEDKDVPSMLKSFTNNIRK